MAKSGPNDCKQISRQRVDKWLWYARMARTRSNAAELIVAGHLRINGERMRAPGYLVKVGDVVTLALDRTVRVMRVEAFADKRGDAAAGRALYRDLVHGFDAVISR